MSQNTTSQVQEAHFPQSTTVEFHLFDAAKLEANELFTKCGKMVTRSFNFDKMQSRYLASDGTPTTKKDSVFTLLCCKGGHHGR